MTKTNTTKIETTLTLEQFESFSQINQNISLLTMLSFTQQLMNSKQQILEEKKQAQEHRKFRKPKGMSKAQVRKRSNDRAAGLEPKKSPPKINRALLQLKNESEFEVKNATELSLECEEIIDKFDLSPKDKELLLNLTNSMRENFSDDDLITIYSRLSSQINPVNPFTSSEFESPRIIAEKTGIKLEEAKDLLKKMYDKLNSESATFITKCISYKPVEEYQKFNIIASSPLFIIGAIAVCCCLRRRCISHEQKQSTRGVENNYPYNLLNEYINDKEIDDACDLILKSGNPIIPYKHPTIITAAIRESHFHSKEFKNQFFLKMRETVNKDNRITAIVKEGILNAIDLGEKQLNLIKKLTPAINRILPNLGLPVAYNIGSFLNIEDKAKMLLLKRLDGINDPNLIQDNILDEKSPMLQEYKESKIEVESNHLLPHLNTPRATRLKGAAVEMTNF